MLFGEFSAFCNNLSHLLIENKLKDADISSHLSAEEIARVFDVKHYLRNIDKVFARVFD